jgi:hypothetical protein
MTLRVLCRGVALVRTNDFPPCEGIRHAGPTSAVPRLCAVATTTPRFFAWRTLSVFPCRIVGASLERDFLRQRHSLCHVGQQTHGL